MLFRTGLLLVLSALLWGVHQSHLQLVNALPLKRELNKQIQVLPPAFTQLLALGHESFVADAIWLQLIQYYGASSLAEIPPDHLESLFHAVTELDPDFEDAYLFSSYLLSDTPSQHQAAIRILKKGTENMPDNWRLPFQIGFIYHIHLKQSAEAAKYFEQAARKPGAPDLPGRLAAQLYKRQKNTSACELSVELWADALKRAPNQTLKDQARRHHAETRIACDLLSLRQALQRFSDMRQERYQQSVKEAKADNKPAPKPPTSFYPAQLSVLHKMGLVRQIPIDPLDRAYVYDAKKGQIKVKPLPWRPIDLSSHDLSQ